MIWHGTIPVEFNHCDPAPMVFYRRYLEMTNSAVENSFAEGLHYHDARIAMDVGHGVASVRIKADFRMPSYWGDRIAFAPAIQRIGQSSAALDRTGRAREETQLNAAPPLGWVTPEARAARWPGETLSRVGAYREARR